VVHAAQCLHHLFQARPLATQFLGALGMVPDGGILQFAADLDQAFLLGIEVKDTP
jgi:hypothetical protein